MFNCQNKTYPLLASSNPSGASIIVEMREITKSFDGFLANSAIDFDIRYGEIHSLLGENGAGKTTLMKVLYGLLRPNSGEIYIDGKMVKLKTPRDAIACGIGMVHQHFMLISQHTVLENIILGINIIDDKVETHGSSENIITRFKKRLFTFSEEHKMKIQRIASEYDLKVNLDAKIWQLSVGERQRVEILKTIYRGAKLLILDEPGSNLTPRESEGLSYILKSMAKQGISIVLITHNLREAMSISDRITVLRAGRKMGTLQKGQYSQESLTRMVIGHEVSFAKLARDGDNRGQKGVLKLENVSAKNDVGVTALKEISLDLKGSEILGLAGVEGNGQRELLEVIMGLRKATKGRVSLNNQEITGKPTSEILGQGVAYIPQDRNTEGLVGDFNIIDNLILDRYREEEFSNHLLIHRKNAERHALSMIKEYDIKCRDPETPASTLSGGNTQRVIIARELSRWPSLLVANQPTRGLDVASSEFVLAKLIQHAKRGCAVIFSSTELDQLLRASDKIAVMYEGRIQGIVKPSETNLQEIGLLMLGKR
jgi:simple sugar transport system ATP-binding protein